MVKKQTSVMVTEQKSVGLNLTELQGEDLRKAELWLVDLTENAPLGSTDKTDGKNSTANVGQYREDQFTFLHA